MNEQQTAPQAATVTTPTDREIRIERVFNAPRDVVFAAMTNPDLVPEWYGPHGTETIVDQMDVRTGGYWRYICRNPDGSEFAFRGAYREITPPERIVQTFEFEPMAGHVSVETMTLEDLGDKTRIVVVSLFHTTEERDGMLASGMEKGMNETYERLDSVLAGILSQ